MYVENKSDLDAPARIGWVRFSKSGRTIYYRKKELLQANIESGNFIDKESREIYWVSGIKSRGSNTHYAESRSVEVDHDAKEEYARLRKRTA